MGLYERDYARDDEPGNLSATLSQLSIVVWLIIINAAIWVVDWFMPPVPEAADGQLLSYTLALKTDFWQVGPWVAESAFGTVQAVLQNVGQLLWGACTFLTSGFAHSPLRAGGIWHLVFNMFGLFVFGRDLEERLGRREFLAFYLVSIVFANLLWLPTMLLLPIDAYGLGASGAVYSLVVLFAMTYPFRKLLLMGIFPLDAWVVGVMYVALSLFGFLSSGHDGVAHAAHLGGALFGFIYARANFHLAAWLPMQFLPQRPEPEDQGGYSDGYPSEYPDDEPSYLKYYDPLDEEEREEQLQEEEADRLLEKVHREGAESLTAREREVLEEYSRRVRQRRR